MIETIPNLYTIVPSDNTSPVAPTFLAVRPEGNLLFGNGAGAEEYFKKIEKLGPIIGVYIGDRHQGKTYSPAAKHFKATYTWPYSWGTFISLVFRKKCNYSAC